ncbi:hypothetical protein AKJ09_07991 [Labilithrix luteola]|uniref:Uncharacterized protein n=1 Tax=Labilithrix luteola TaxID=1391654 RepID=A0A0K1Q6G8_9BACT|nr:hypothetical protein [Labilithrix luteola]AKV01328.1 hypothetical protein AKJ09_07991 [Labilithrix luteola]
MNRFGIVASATMVVVLGCSSSETGKSVFEDPVAKDQASTNSEDPPCGIVMYPPDYPASCEADLEQRCCSQLKACSIDPGCVEAVRCLNDCPAPRTNECVLACGRAAPPESAARLDAGGVCSFRVAFRAGTACNWPR